MSKKSDKYLKVNGHVVRLPKKAYTSTIDATAKHNRERTQELADAYLDAREKGLIEKKHEGANIVPYSFRHYYSLRGHIAGIDSGSMAKSMGHSIEAHHRNYPYSSEASTTNAFKRARERATA